MRQMKRKELERKFVAIEALYRRHREVQESGPIEDMKGECEAQILGVPFPLVQLKNFLNDDYPWRVSDKEQLRQEIVGDVSPCIGASNNSAIAPGALSKLVAKINDMGLYAPWCVTDLTKKKVSPELEKLFGEGDHDLEPKGPVLKLGSGKFIVHNQFDFDLDETPTNRQAFYTIIIRALTDGAFHKLKRCKECNRFFIADRLSDRFCRPECGTAFFSKDAAKRVRKSRERRAANAGAKKVRKPKRSKKR